MNRQRLISQVREYARLQPRARMNYTAQVQTLFDLRVQSIMRDYKDEPSRLREFDWTVEFIYREFGRATPGFALDVPNLPRTQPMG